MLFNNAQHLILVVVRLYFNIYGSSHMCLFVTARKFFFPHGARH